MSNVTLTASGSMNLSVPSSEVFRILIEPAEQMRWNSLYLEARADPPGEIRTGSVMIGTFKGSGKSQVQFEEVIAGRQFVHYSPLKLFNFIYLGEFRHKYEVKEAGGQTVFTQTVYFQPKGIGRLLARTVMNNFRKRLPESFKELEQYLSTAN